MPDSARAVTPSLPAEVASALDELVGRAREVLGSDLQAVVLYGTAAEGALRPTSDVNVLLVLTEFDRSKVDGLRDAFRVAKAAVRLSAMFLLREEVEPATQAFAQKFADVLRRRRVLYGADPFAGLAIPRSALTARLVQVLLNLTIRLRAVYVERSSREEQVAKVIADAAGPLRTCAASLLELEGRPGLSPRDALRALASAFGEEDWAPVLARISQAREGQLLAPGVAPDTLVRLIELTQLMRARVLALRPIP
jgi:predicted nucleotidyltransferase